MICEKCDNNIDDDSKFCSFCGNKIENNTNKIEVVQKEANLKDEETQKKMGFYDFYLNYKGSIGRKEFFFRGFLPLAIINLLLLIAMKITSNLEFYHNFYGFLKYVTFILSLFIFVIISNITIKRIHDINSKSWFFILNAVPFLNIFLLLYLISAPSSKIRNHGETNYYKLNSKKILFSIVNIFIIILLLFTFSFLNILLKAYLNSNNTISTQNKILIPFKNPQTGKYGFISSKGEWVISPKFEQASIFSDNLAKVNFNNKYGFINKKGDFEIQPIFGDFTSSFSEGLAQACIQINYFINCGFIDKKGNWVIEPIYGFSSSFSEGLARVFIYPKYGFIDKKGKVVLETNYKIKSDKFIEGMAIVEINGKYGFIDKNNNLAIKPIFDYANDFSEGLAEVKLGNSFYYVDKNGNLSLEHTSFLDANFSEGLARFKIDNKWGFIDKNGNIILNPIFDYASDFSDGLAQVTINKKVGFINKNGDFIIKPIYDNIYEGFYEGFAIAQKDGKHFIINTNGNAIAIKEINL